MSRPSRLPSLGERLRGFRNAKLRDELLNRKASDSLLGTQVPAERWGREYNTERPHGSLGNLTPQEYAQRTAAGGPPPGEGQESPALSEETPVTEEELLLVG